MKAFATLILSLSLLLTTAQAGQEAQPVTRGELVTALWDSMGAVPWGVTAPFSDLDGDSACADAVSWAWDNGLTLGTGDDCFSPDRPVTREEAAVLLRRFSVLLGRNTFVPDGLAECNDNADCSPWADDALYWATDIGLLAWSPGGRLDPQGLLTLEQLIELMEHFEHPSNPRGNGPSAQVP